VPPCLAYGLDEGLTNFLSMLASNCTPPNLCLPSNCYYRCEPPHLVTSQSNFLWKYQTGQELHTTLIRILEMKLVTLTPPPSNDPTNASSLCYSGPELVKSWHFFTFGCFSFLIGFLHPPHNSSFNFSQ
jgi:hypothetical protein